MAASARAVIIYDGVCNVCNKGVQFLARNDPAGRVAYVALQSKAAEPVLKATGLKREDVHRKFALIEGRIGDVIEAGLNAGGEVKPPAGVPPTWASKSSEGVAQTPTGLRVHRASAAALRAAYWAHNGGGAAWLGAASAAGELVPESLRDAIYGAIADSRYSVFGRTVACQLPPAGLLERFVNKAELQGSARA
ncbi:hypothetical protein FNF27_00699 [Cafeteria roenbergensis]|uniref:Thiol-disulfide oxidoreductase DCC n=1 Tax=Cafeteria roenbergensis TaxID=33653 RepID=A0A5A8C387_CAFRO|nr:hypothetical protein FNF29_07566 [Cafeteria roenbergensis]KAA0158887.1 hypothetical protein FNF31_05180 [Cafeteria roenbergensis]KAA0169955.1 hypothetical protein FNF28_01745 [Cafeteria roenbergensis]KAA0177529.1 hypothetical protein FNF27_00699 [Cafeteria roenbergensis]|eukprot:KAA0147194.1 hypothetical protein FNF29_07566 [Cafeteria roenbergensis]